jgi:hypothetical protein
MYLQQRDFIRPAENPTEPPLDINYALPARHRSIFAAFLNALYQSRRLKAERVIHQHRHLIAALRARSDASATPD